MRCAPRTSAPRCSSCPPPRTPRRTAPSPTPSGCCSGTTRRSSRPATAAATCGSTTSSGGGSRQRLAGSTEPRDRAVQDLTWDYPVDDSGEPSADAVLREVNGTGPDGTALSGYTALKADGSTACGCWIYSGVYADEVNQSMRRKPGRGAGQRRARVGLGLADEPPRPLQPGLRRPRGPAVERAQEADLVGRREVDRRRRPGLPGGHRAGLPAARGRPGGRGDRRQRAVHHAGRRAGLAVRAGRAGRRADADALRAAGVAAAQRAAPGAPGQPGARAVRPAGQPLPPRTRHARRRGVPVRVHHVPGHRAPHRGRDEPLDPAAERAAAGDVPRGLPAAGRRARAAQRRSGRTWSPRGRRSRAGCW